MIFFTTVSGVGSSPKRGCLAEDLANRYCCTRDTCEASQVLLAGVPGFFPRGSHVFAPPTDWPV